MEFKEYHKESVVLAEIKFKHNKQAYAYVTLTCNFLTQKFIVEGHAGDLSPRCPRFNKERRPEEHYDVYKEFEMAPWVYWEAEKYMYIVAEVMKYYSN